MTLSIRREKRKARHYLEDLGNNVVLDMVLIPAGSFLMGSPEDESERYDDESPQHSVTVSSFFMGKYPITQAQWRIVAGFEQANRLLDPDPSGFKGDDRPVENVSWHDAVEFCERLSRFIEGRLAQQTKRKYRLPSESEWEYACRAGTTTPFYFGKTITPDLANYDWDKSYGETQITKQKDFKGTTPVGQFRLANGFGLYDMHGNVWEWCQDHWHGNYEGAPNTSGGAKPCDGSAWVAPDADENADRVLRGGSWICYPWLCRSATRLNNVAGLRDNYISFGFRVVCSAPRTL
ncbi:MAG: formylglycine-generating enzyme family protein [Leptolyngbyaceae cyanobacterium CSU_1_3]|nr:formylglycine-generating enzyme family protein [Leptolyngbyaceae cyanobacterium CSU_1_3]